MARPKKSKNKEKAPFQLKSCYEKCIELAEKYCKDNNLNNITIGFPCISTGIYGYPKDEACKIAIDTVKEHSNQNLEVKFVCYEELDYKLYMNYFNDTEKSIWIIKINYSLVVIKMVFESEVIIW